MSGLRPTPVAERPRAAKPLYREEHSSCSVLVGRIRSEDRLLSLPPHDQFRWLHRFYMLLDRIADQHKVYKLHGGQNEFMLATNVAEHDKDHPERLLRFVLHLLQVSEAVRLPGQVPLDLVMVLTSGPACSGLLGTCSLTHQIVGQGVSVARELLITQSHSPVPLMITPGMHTALPTALSARLRLVGNVRLQCSLGAEEAVYSLPQYANKRLSQPYLLPTVTAESSTPHIHTHQKGQQHMAEMPHGSPSTLDAASALFTQQP